MEQQRFEEDLSDASLSASVLRSVTGLTLRHVNECAKHDALPSVRRGKRGWRHVNAWQLMSLHVIAELHSDFGMPLERSLRSGGRSTTIRDHIHL